MTDENEEIETGHQPEPNDVTEEPAQMSDSSEQSTEDTYPESEPVEEAAVPDEVSEPHTSITPEETEAVGHEESEPSPPTEEPEELAEDKAREVGEVQPAEEPTEEPTSDVSPPEELVADSAENQLDVTEPVSEPPPPTEEAESGESAVTEEAETAEVPEEEEAGAEETPAEPSSAEETPAEPEEVGEESPAEGEPKAEAAEEPPAEPEAEAEGAEETPAEPDNKKWYVVKVQSGREETIKNAIERRVKIEGLEDYFGRVLIPTEKVPTVRKVTTKNKQGEKITKEKRVTKEVKKFPGYLMVNVEFNDQILYLFRETAGVGDFVGGSLNRLPTPMSEREVQKMLGEQGEPTPGEEPGKKYEQPVFDFGVGDRVRVKEGSFEDLEGEVKEIVPPKDEKDTTKIRVELTLWGRPMEVEIEPWNVESA